MIFQEFLTPGWITLGISLIGFISFYLGKVVLDFYPTQEDKTLNYIVGFVLFLTYILIPLLFFYYFPKLVLHIGWTLFIIFWLVYGILAWYFKTKVNVFLIKRGKADKFFYEVASKNMSKFGFTLESQPQIKSFFNKLFMNLPGQLKVIFLGYLTIFLVVNIFLFFSNWIIRLFIFIATIQTFNHLLILHNAKLIKYEEVSVVDVNNKKFRGSLIKEDSEYVILNTEKGFYSFPRESIKRIYKEIRIDTVSAEKRIDKMALVLNKLLKNKNVTRRT